MNTHQLFYATLIVSLACSALCGMDESPIPPTLGRPPQVRADIECSPNSAYGLNSPSLTTKRNSQPGKQLNSNTIITRNSLYSACKEGDKETVEELLTRYPKMVDIPHPEWNLTPLAFACIHLHSPIVTLLLEKNADPSRPISTSKKTILATITSKKFLSNLNKKMEHATIVKALIEHTAQNIHNT